MRSLEEKFDEWAEDEDEDVMNLFKKNYGPLPQLSMLFPSWKRSMRPFSIALYVIHTTLLGTHLVLLLITIVQTVSEWNLELTSLAVHFMLLVSYGIFLLNYVPHQRKVYVKQSMIMLKDVGRYRSGRIYDEAWCVKEEKQIRKETLYYLILPALIALGSTFILGLPYISSWISGMENPYTPMMVNKNLPVPCWYPFPTHEGLLHVVAVMGQLLAAGCLAPIVIQVLMYFLINSQRIKYEYRVLGYSIETAFSRAKKLLLRMNPNKRGTAVRTRDPAFQKVVGMCLIDSVIHHHAIAELVSLYSQELDWPGALAFSIGTGVIGMSLFNILKGLKDNNPSTVILFSIMMCLETLVMYVLASLGAAITDESVKLRNHLYFVKWYDLDIPNRKLLLNFHTAMTQPIVVSALGLIDLSLDTFSSIMNTAYSFFNLMNVQDEM